MIIDRDELVALLPRLRYYAATFVYPDDIDDCVSATVEAALRKKNYRPQGAPLFGYLCGVVRGVFRNMQRSRARYSSRLQAYEGCITPSQRKQSCCYRRTALDEIIDHEKRVIATRIMKRFPILCSYLENPQKANLEKVSKNLETARHIYRVIAETRKIPFDTNLK